ncbi:MAG: DsbA family protein [Chloroflexi bacterium]|nr:DsbA family protein [Chloroflexota bacterium]
MWLAEVKKVWGERLVVNWRYFSLEQVNSQEGPEWKLWEQPDSYYSRGRLAFHAAEAARRQGPEAFERFHLALLRARHEEKKDIADRAVVLDVARQARLDLPRFEADLRDRALLRRLAEDHTQAVERYGVFGTPTLVFPNGGAAYLKMRPAPAPQDALRVFEHLHQIVAGWPFITEVKRPVPGVRTT